MIEVDYRVRETFLGTSAIITDAGIAETDRQSLRDGGVEVMIAGAVP